MGAWGADTFENDDAVDWAAELPDEGLRLLHATLDKAAIPASEYLEAPEASEVLAACDVIARLRGQAGQADAYTEEVDAWVAKQSVAADAAMLAIAVAAVDRVLAKNSELAELWDESGDPAWQQSVADLRRRLTT